MRVSSRSRSRSIIWSRSNPRIMGILAKEQLDKDRETLLVVSKDIISVLSSVPSTA